MAKKEAKRINQVLYTYTTKWIKWAISVKTIIENNRGVRFVLP